MPKAAPLGTNVCHLPVSLGQIPAGATEIAVALREKHRGVLRTAELKSAVVGLAANLLSATLN
jgi:hypothetical protein